MWETQTDLVENDESSLVELFKVCCAKIPCTFFYSKTPFIGTNPDTDLVNWTQFLENPNNQAPIVVLQQHMWSDVTFAQNHSWVSSFMPKIIRVMLPDKHRIWTNKISSTVHKEHEEWMTKEDKDEFARTMPSSAVLNVNLSSVFSNKTDVLFAKENNGDVVTFSQAVAAREINPLISQWKLSCKRSGTVEPIVREISPKVWTYMESLMLRRSFTETQKKLITNVCVSTYRGISGLELVSQSLLYMMPLLSLFATPEFIEKYRSICVRRLVCQTVDSQIKLNIIESEDEIGVNDKARRKDIHLEGESEGEKEENMDKEQDRRLWGSSKKTFYLVHLTMEQSDTEFEIMHRVLFPSLWDGLSVSIKKVVESCVGSSLVQQTIQTPSFVVLATPQSIKRSRSLIKQRGWKEEEVDVIANAMETHLLEPSPSAKEMVETTPISITPFLYIATFSNNSVWESEQLSTDEMVRELMLKNNRKTNKLYTTLLENSTKVNGLF